MATDIKWEAPAALQAYLSTELDSDADETLEVGASIDNESTTLNTHMDVWVHLGQADFTSKTGGIWVYLLESIDGGTTYDQGVDTATLVLMPPFDKVCAILDIREGSGSEVKDVVKSMIPIPPGQFKIGFRNKTGVALAATLNTLKYRLYNLNNV